MQSLNICFAEKNLVETRSEPVAELGANEILIETQRSLISTGTESIVLGGKFAAGTHWDNWAKYPFYPGYSAAGRVLRVGASVQDFVPGDRVAARSKHKQYAPYPDTRRPLKIPAGVSDEDATFFGLACITQIGVRRARHELGDTVAVIGLGLLGQLVTQYVRALGASEIVAIDTADARLKMARTHGATHVLQMGADAARDAVFDLTGGRGVDVVYDITGHAAVFGPALRLARKYGKLVLLGDTGTPGDQRLTPDVITRGISIVGAHDSHSPAEETDENYWTAYNMARLFFTYLERGQMRVSDLITHRYSPEEAPTAYAMLQTDRASAMGVIFDWSKISK